MDYNIYELYETDEDKEAGEGIPLWFGHTGDIWIRIRRAGGANKEFSRVHAQKMRPYERDRSLGKLAESKGLEILAKVYSETIILDWGGITDREGQEISFSKDAVVKLLLDLPELFNEVRIQASMFGNFLIGKRELVGEELGGGSSPTLQEVGQSVA